MDICRECSVELTADNRYKSDAFGNRRICKTCSKATRNTNKRRERQEVINHYGGKCACCGETQYEFLAFDHIAGGGKQHLATLKNKKLGDFIRKNDYPDGFRVLCHNCNMSLGAYGYCPHNGRLAEFG